MVINTNVSAQSSARLLGESSAMLSKSLARLSSGSKIVSPEDDAAGLAVSMRFDAQINRVQASRNNISNAISFSQTQDGFLSKVAKALDRMSELAMLAQDVTKQSSDLNLYQEEFKALKGYIGDVAAKQFNGVTLFSGTGLSVTKDEDGAAFAMAAVDLADAAFTGLTVAASGQTVDSAVSAAAALTSVKGAITKLAEFRAKVGANVSRLNFTNEQLSILKDNLSAANSRIKDVDVAEESTQFARYNILVQAGTAMLAQANATPQSALRLLQ
jgi:flagellin